MRSQHCATTNGGCMHRYLAIAAVVALGLMAAAPTTAEARWFGGHGHHCYHHRHHHGYHHGHGYSWGGGGGWGGWGDSDDCYYPYYYGYSYYPYYYGYDYDDGYYPSWYGY